MSPQLEAVAAFLDRFPLTSAVFIDLPDVLELHQGICGTQELEGQDIAGDTSSSLGRSDNMASTLSSFPTSFTLVRDGNPNILRSAVDCLTERGILLIHDFFLEHFPEKAALSDLNMFINTHNGRVFPGKSVRNSLAIWDFFVQTWSRSGTDTAVLFGTHEEAGLGSLRLDVLDLLISRIRAQGSETCI